MRTKLFEWWDQIGSMRNAEILLIFNTLMPFRNNITYIYILGISISLICYTRNFMSFSGYNGLHLNFQICFIEHFKNVKCVKSNLSHMSHRGTRFHNICNSMFLGVVSFTLLSIENNMELWRLQMHQVGMCK